MRILLDECLPRRLREDLPGHQVATVPERGWSGQKNGALLSLAEERFDVLITMDRGIPFQQNLGGLAIGLLVIVAPTNRLSDLRPLMNQVRHALPLVRAGEVVRVGP